MRFLLSLKVIIMCKKIIQIITQLTKLMNVHCIGLVSLGFEFADSRKPAAAYVHGDEYFTVSIRIATELDPGSSLRCK